MAKYKVIIVTLLFVLLIGCAKTEERPDIKTKLGVIRYNGVDDYEVDFKEYSLIYKGKKQQHKIEDLEDVVDKMKKNNIKDISFYYENEFTDNTTLTLKDNDIFTVEIEQSRGRLICDIKNSKENCTFYRDDAKDIIDYYYSDFYKGAKKSSLDKLEE